MILTGRQSKNTNTQHTAPPHGGRGGKGKGMFKQFIARIIAAENREDAIQNVFYGTKYEGDKVVEYGIDMAYQRGKITWKESEILLALIEKMA